jgi:hypothetical protein
MGVEIDITPAMIEAGVEAYLQWENSEDQQIENGVRLILEAALRAASDLSE